MKRLLLIAIALILVVGFGAPYLDADFARPKIERALQRGLGRKVEVGKVYFNLFTGPGFKVEDVTIYEDARAGIEPFAHVWELQGRVRLLSLLSRRLEFSSVTLGEGTDINLVKTEAGPWNFQFLLGDAAKIAMPAIRMRSGRVNFKFGDTKSVFYFNDADFDVSPATDGSVEIRFSGAPSRTDRAHQNFGHFFVRGAWTGQKLDMRVELERSALEEVARMLDRRGFGLHGIIAFDAQLSGAPSNLQIEGQLQIDDVHRWDLLPKRGGGFRVPYKGTLDLHGERLDLASTTDAPNPLLALQFRAWDFLSKPHWEASSDVKQVPVATLVEVARHMGVGVSDQLAAEGSVSGAIGYGDPDGWSGRVEVQDASLTLPGAQPLRAANAVVSVGGGIIALDAATVRVGENESAEIEGSFEPSAGLDLKITTRGLTVADVRSFGLAAIPLLEQTTQGTWRGAARYRWTPADGGEWSGDYELQNARIALDGVADPLRIQSASVSSSGAKVSVSRLRARLGEVAFTGEYRWEPAAVRPNKFHLIVPEVDAAELERLFAPALVRERGFIARTLRLGPAPVPDWLQSRRADGTLSIGSMTVGDSQVHIESMRLLWDGALVRLVHLDARVDGSPVIGEVALDLAGRSPHYRFEGKLQEVPYKSGRLDFEGNVDADGSGVQLLASARGEGHLRGRAIAFAPDAEFRGVSGCFELLPGPRWKISSLEATQGAETFSGTGSTQADGRLVLELTNHGRQFRFSGAPPAAISQP